MLMLVYSAIAQAQWERLPLYGGHAWKLVQSKFNPDDIFAITERSGVWYSSDGGDNWRPINGKNNELVHQEVKDLEVGRDGSIFLIYDRHLYFSSDNGSSWNQIDNPQNPEVYLDNFIEIDVNGRLFINARLKSDPDTPLILYSDDNGLSWKNVPLTSEIDWRLHSFRIDFKDSRRIIVNGAFGLLAATTDFGTTWKDANMDRSYRSIYTPEIFTRRDTTIYAVWCYYGTNPWRLDYYESKNLGGTWVQKNRSPIRDPLFMVNDHAPIRLSDSGTLYSPGKNIILSSSDDGGTWVSYNSRTNWDVLINKKTFIGSATIDGIFTSSDEGRTWQYASTVEGFSAFSRIEFQIANDHTFFVIVSDRDYLSDKYIYELRQSTDAGKTWTPLFRSNSLANLRVASEPEIRYYCMHDENVVLRGGLNQTVPDTILTWPKSYNPPSIEGQKFSLKLSPVQPGLVYVSAATHEGRRLFHSTDGGDTWKKNKMPPFVYMYFEIFPSELYPGTVVGVSGPPFSTQNFGMGIWLTRDYGWTWRMRENSTLASEGYTLFGDDILFRTWGFEFSSDYGHTWTKNINGLDPRDTTSWMGHVYTDGRFIIRNNLRSYQFIGDRWVLLKTVSGEELQISGISTLTCIGNEVYVTKPDEGLFKAEIADPTGIQELRHSANIPFLGQNHPNPFTENTIIPIHTTEYGRLTIYDVYGRQVKKIEIPGDCNKSNNIEWNGKDENGRPAPVGMYLYILETRSSRQMRKMLKLR